MSIETDLEAPSAAPDPAVRRSAEAIGHTPDGPRPLPPLRPQPEVPAPDDANRFERTIAHTGRDPQWSGAR